MAAIAKEMEEAAAVRERGEFELAPVDEAGVPLTREEELARGRRDAAGRVEEIRNRYTRRMHDLSWFMKSLLERFTKWFNGKHTRSGTLWEDMEKISEHARRASRSASITKSQGSTRCQTSLRRSGSGVHGGS